MKYVTAVLASAFIFLAVFVLTGLLLFAVLPRSYLEFGIELGATTVNIPSVIAFLLAAFAATYTFKASFYAKTGKLYKAKKESKSDS